MDKALLLLEKFAVDAQNGKIPEDVLRVGAPWRHPPETDVAAWAKIQLMDFIQSLVNSWVVVNYFAGWRILPLMHCYRLVCCTPNVPSFIRPVSRGIQRCLVRWLVQERLNMSLKNSVRFHWQHDIRGRSYRHLLKQVGVK